MVLPGTCVIFHNKPGNRMSWGHHGTPGCYICPSLEHYRCIQCYIPTTGIVHITDTLQYILKTFAFPKTKTEDDIQQAIGDIIEIMHDPPNTLPFSSNGYAQKCDQPDFSYVTAKYISASPEKLQFPPILLQSQTKIHHWHSWPIHLH